MVWRQTFTTAPSNRVNDKLVGKIFMSIQNFKMYYSIVCHACKTLLATEYTCFLKLVNVHGSIPSIESRSVLSPFYEMLEGVHSDLWSIFGPFWLFFRSFCFWEQCIDSERQLGVQPGVPDHAKPPRTRLVTLWPDMSRGLSVEDT